MVEPAHIKFKANGTGEFAFGCIKATLRCDYSPDGASFTWIGFDEMTEVSGDGSADITNDGTLEGEIAFLDGDEAQFKAEKE